MIFIVDSRGHLLCPQFTEKRPAAQCRGTLKAVQHDRFKMLRCDRCGWELHCTGFMVWDVCLAIDPNKVLYSMDRVYLDEAGALHCGICQYNKMCRYQDNGNWWLTCEQCGYRFHASEYKLFIPMRRPP